MVPVRDRVVQEVLVAVRAVCVERRGREPLRVVVEAELASSQARAGSGGSGRTYRVEVRVELKRRVQRAGDMRLVDGRVGEVVKVGHGRQDRRSGPPVALSGRSK
jgi:hypothetical protein